MDFERYFFIEFMWQMYLIYLRKALILVSGLGIFFRGLGWGPFLSLFFNCWFLAEPLQCGIPLGTGHSKPGSFPSSIPSFPSSRAERREGKTPFVFPEQLLLSAALF